MTESKNDPSAKGAQHELVITRIFDAPRELLFKLWTDLEHAKQWMGPREYPIVKIEADLRPGGKWRACLRAKDGSGDLWQGGVYREIVEPERLVYTFAWDEETGQPARETLVTITFAEEEGKTKMTFRQAPFDSAATRDGHRDGWNSSFDRMDEYLAEVLSNNAKATNAK